MPVYCYTKLYLSKVDDLCASDGVILVTFSGHYRLQDPTSYKITQLCIINLITYMFADTCQSVVQHVQNFLKLYMLAHK